MMTVRRVIGAMRCATIGWAELLSARCGGRADLPCPPEHLDRHPCIPAARRHCSRNRRKRVGRSANTRGHNRPLPARTPCDVWRPAQKAKVRTPCRKSSCLAQHTDSRRGMPVPVADAPAATYDLRSNFTSVIIHLEVTQHFCNASETRGAPSGRHAAVGAACHRRRFVFIGDGTIRNRVTAERRG